MITTLFRRVYRHLILMGSCRMIHLPIDVAGSSCQQDELRPSGATRSVPRTSVGGPAWCIFPGRSLP
jgi:hypothetical protein